jgi:hypothetical protein
MSSSDSVPGKPPSRKSGVAWLDNLAEWVEGNEKRVLSAKMRLARSPKPTIPYGGWPWERVLLRYCRENRIHLRTVAERMGLSITYLRALMRLRNGWRRREGSLTTALRITSSAWRAAVETVEKDDERRRRRRERRSIQSRGGVPAGRDRAQRGK